MGMQKSPPCIARIQIHRALGRSGGRQPIVLHEIQSISRSSQLPCSSDQGEGILDMFGGIPLSGFSWFSIYFPMRF